MNICKFYIALLLFIINILIYSCKKDAPIIIERSDQDATEYIRGKFENKFLYFENKISGIYDSLNNKFDAKFYLVNSDNSIDTIRLAFFNFQLKNVNLPYLFTSYQSNINPFAGLEYKPNNSQCTDYYTLISAYDSSKIIIDSIISNTIIKGRFYGKFTTQISLENGQYSPEGCNFEIDSGEFRIIFSTLGN